MDHMFLSLIILFSYLTYTVSNPLFADNTSSDLSQSAFCHSYNDRFQKYFPMHYPEAHLPWVWDAAYDPIEKTVEISTISRRNCYFNQTIWNRLLTLFPKYAKHLGGGLISNILVPADFHDSFDFTGKLNKSQGIQMKTVLCNFYKNEKLVYQSPSKIIQVVPHFLDNCPIQIKCPVNLEKYNKNTGLMNWDSMKIERDPKLFISKGINLVEKETEAFPVCNLPYYQKQQKQYDLSICAYMFESKTETLIEWLEYHIHVGIDHFFIYSTAIKTEKRKNLEIQLKYYIKLGIVTLVSWPYMNCVREWGTGRYIYFYEPSPDGKIHHNEMYTLKRSFKPPKKIMQSSAIASCYARFKYTSNYIAQIDIDEYLMVDTNSNIFRNHNSYKSEYMKNTFKDFVNIVFNKYPNAPALAIRPIMMDECVQKSYKTTYNSYKLENKSNILSINFDNNNNNGQFILPRLGKWQHARRGIIYESKLIVRTEAVDNVYVHYVTQFSSEKWKEKNVIHIFLKHAVLLHYKEKGGIIGGVLDPHDIRSEEELKRVSIVNICQDKNTLPVSLDKSINSKKNVWSFNTKIDKLDFSRQGLSPSDIKLLFKIYIDRMNMINNDLFN